jgi:hypothetical protein
MNWPGEQLIIRLWETLAEKGVGGLLKPWQITREGTAQIELRRYELLAIAAAEKEAAEIRSGARELKDSKYLLSLTEPSHRQDAAATPTAPQPVIQFATRSIIADAMKKELNIAKAITYAEAELKNDSSPPPEKKIEEDWLHRWRECAGQISADELQALWGKILAGEVKAPGSYSYRLLEFIKNLTKDEAVLIEKVSCFMMSGFIAREPKDAIEAEGITFSMLLELQELGVIAGVESIGMQNTFKSQLPDRFIRILFNHGKGLLVESEEKDKILKIGAYVVTSLGKQLLMLGNFKPSENYLMSVGAAIKKKGFKVSLVDYQDIGADTVRYFNNKEIE